MHLNQQSNVGRSYILRKEGGRGLQGIEETVKFAIHGLENYLQESTEHMLVAVRLCIVI